MKKIHKMIRDVPQHWVGDGFPVRTLFSYQEDSSAISPFLLLDYGGPHTFSPAEAPRGVGEHPHRGFETVTIVYDGEVQHRDSSGNQGTIGPGDVQWMTAASGVVHEEFHSPQFARTGGAFEMVQLWVNLPASVKMSPPRYQEIRKQAIPAVELDDSAGMVRVIAGNFRGIAGPAHTFTPIELWDLRLTAGHRTEFDLPDGFNAAVVVRQGAITVNESESARAGEAALFQRGGERITVDCQEDATVLLLGGQPLDEPVAGRGPFVMNTAEEIRQAILDFKNGQMGQLQ